MRKKEGRREGERERDPFLYPARLLPQAQTRVKAGKEEFQSCAFFTLETLESKLKGVTSPTTVTFLVAKSTSKDLMPAQDSSTQWIVVHGKKVC